MYLITFTDVGRQRASWTDELTNLSESEILRAVKNKKALVTKFPDIEIIEKEKNKVSGKIYVGGGRCVGNFTAILI